MISSEIRLIAGFRKYAVSVDGIVYREPCLTRVETQTRNGYVRVRLTGDCGRRHWRAVHCLVLQEFVGPRPTCRHHGAHLDGNRQNNRLENLAWKTPEENEADKLKHGTAPKGGFQKRLSGTTVSQILDAHRSGSMSLTQISLVYDLHRSSVSRIIKRELSKAS